MEGWVFLEIPVVLLEEVSSSRPSRCEGFRWLWSLRSLSSLSVSSGSFAIFLKAEIVILKINNKLNDTNKHEYFSFGLIVNQTSKFTGLCIFLLLLLFCTGNVKPRWRLDTDSDRCGVLHNAKLPCHWWSFFALGSPRQLLVLYSVSPP